MGTVEIDFPTTEDRIFAYGVISDGRVSIIQVGSSRPLSIDSLTYRIPDSDVQVSILKDGSEIVKLGLAEYQGFSPNQPEFMPLRSTFYTSVTPLQLDSGSYYSLKVVAKGFPELVSERIRYEPEVNWQESAVFYFVSGLDKECQIDSAFLQIVAKRLTDKRYRVVTESRLTELGAGTIYGNMVGGLLLDDISDTVTYTSPPILPVLCSEINSFGGYILSTSDEAFTQFDNFSGTLNIGGVFSTPAAAPSNVTGGYGYISLGESGRLRTVIVR